MSNRVGELARNIYREGAGETFRLIIPPSALREIIDPESIDWKDPPEVDVWAGDRLLAFEMANLEERTVEINREPPQENERND